MGVILVILLVSEHQIHLLLHMSPGRAVELRMRYLQQLYDDGILTAIEYKEKKQSSYVYLMLTVYVATYYTYVTVIRMYIQPWMKLMQKQPT